jgi:WD40 repeat protein
MSAAAFALADGSLAIARTKDSEPAAKRLRRSAEDGRSTIVPRSKPLAPITRFVVNEDKAVALTAYGKHGFVLGDQAGKLISVTSGGERTPFSIMARGGITAIDHAQERGLLACATERHEVTLIDSGKSCTLSLDHTTPVHGLKLSPDGRQLAVAQEDLITLWNVEGTPAKALELPAANVPLTLVWSPDQTMIAAGFERLGVGIWHAADSNHLAFPDYPSPVRSLAWSADGTMLVTSGAFRVIAWSLRDLKANGTSPSASPLETGKPSLVAVEAVAAHPTRPLIAAGYENGMLILAHIGSRDEMVIKTEGGGGITCLAWSKGGGHLAVGSDRGLTALIELPPQLFK